MGGILALDVGERRIGMAVSEWADIVTPLGVIPVGPGDIDAVLRHVVERGIDAIVVGLPISLDDRIGPKAKRVVRFARRVGEVCRLPVYLHDERFSTHEAEDLLLEADVSRMKRRNRIDSVAAARILQSYLEWKKENEAPRKTTGAPGNSPDDPA